MRFLADRCVPRPVVIALRELGHDVLESRELGPDPGDRELIGWAVEQGRVVLTMDKDMPELALRHRVRHAGIIQVPQTSFDRIIVMIRNFLGSTDETVLGQSVAIFRGERLRLFRVIEPNV